MDEKNRKEYLSVVLGALLHDIGKFMQRAELEKVYPEIVENYDGFCPTGEHGRPGYLHAAHTAYFIDRYIPDGLIEKAELYNAARHHKNVRGDIYKEADMLSSGMDRDQRESDEEKGRDAYKRERLYSVFEAVDLSDENDAKEMRYRYELKELSDDLGIAFPREKSILQPAEGELLVPEYLRLWNGFEKEVQSIAATGIETFYSALSQLLLKYTWAIPSSTVDIPDISLYDHSKTTAAIAGCLYLHHAPALDEKALRNGETEKFILLAGDLSGIQNYIFNITHLGAGGSAKRLRARSFTVAILAEIVTHKFLRAFGLVDSHVLMSSGGKFYLLLPKMAGADVLIEQIEKEVAQWLYENLNAEIGLNIAALNLAGKDFKHFNTVFSTMNALLQRKKQTPFLAILKGSQGWSEKFVLGHAVFEDEEKLCKGCGRLPGTHQEEDKYFCRFCSQDKKIGQKLPLAGQIAFHDTSDAGEFALLGFSFDLVKQGEKYQGKPYLVTVLGKWMTMSGVPTGHKYTSYRIPKLGKEDCENCRDHDCEDKGSVVSGNPMMFECIANKSKGRAVLGYLKADVDRLGEVFAFGLKGRTNSVSRIATMSRMLDLFFSGYVEKLQAERYPHIYTVYTGGDDLMMIGPWDNVVDFAREMEREFRRFTCKNPNITLSAGVILAKHRMPVFRSVEMAEGVLHEAKEQPKGHGRDQFWLFGDSMKWDKVDSIIGEAMNVSDWIGAKKMSTGFGRNLLMYGRLKKRFDETRKTEFLQYLPLLSYDIARNIKDNSVRSWADGLKEPGNLTMTHLAVIANYALTANRGGRNDK